MAQTKHSRITVSKGSSDGNALHTANPRPTKKKRGRQPVPPEGKNTIPPLNEARRNLFPDSAGKKESKSYLSFRQYAKAYVISHYVPSYIKSQGTPEVWENYRKYCIAHFSLKLYKLFLKNPNHTMHKTFNLSFEAIIQNCQKIVKESQAEPETDDEATLGAEGGKAKISQTEPETNDEATLGDEGGKADISNTIDNGEESRPLKKKWIEYTLKRDPSALPCIISILYQTVDPSKILATTTAFYQLTLTQGRVTSFISSVKNKFKYYM